MELSSLGVKLVKAESDTVFPVVTLLDELILIKAIALPSVDIVEDVLDEVDVAGVTQESSSYWWSCLPWGLTSLK